MAFKNGLWFRDFQSLRFRPSLPAPAVIQLKRDVCPAWYGSHRQHDMQLLNPHLEIVFMRSDMYIVYGLFEFCS